MKPLKQLIDKNGNPYVWLIHPETGEETKRMVAELVLETFVGIRPTGKNIHHIDGDKQNNNLNNLEWR